MNGPVRFILCAIVGLGVAACGFLWPIHLRAVDSRIIQRAGRKSPGLIERGLALVNEKNLGSALLLLQAAQEEAVSGRGTLALAVTNLAAEHPGFVLWGGDEPHLEVVFGTYPKRPDEGPEPLTVFAVRHETRERVLALLNASPRPIVRELLRCRELTNTVIFAPSQSASGQAFDTALLICGLLAEEARFTPELSNVVFAAAAVANRQGNSQALEQVLLDLMSLGQRFNWGQLSVFVKNIQDAETLRLLANLARKAEAKLPVLFAVVDLSGNPHGVVKYLMTYSQTGLEDLGVSLRYGAGGLNELLRRHQRIYVSGLPPLGLDSCLRSTSFALTLKGLLYLAGGFLLAMGLHFARPAVPPLERRLQVRGFHVAREILFALGFLVVVLLLSEPFLAQESQKVEFPFRLRLPTMGSVVPAGASRASQSFMNQLSLLTLLLFFVLQALIYTACLVKLAEIRRQNMPPRIKLRLLENEEHLFDAGLYLGFAGTIISLILVSLNIIRPSLMAAYGSTSFGIIFVSIFKIFHLRPERRKLLLEAEFRPGENAAPAATPA